MFGKRVQAQNFLSKKQMKGMWFVPKRVESKASERLISPWLCGEYKHNTMGNMIQTVLKNPFDASCPQLENGAISSQATG